MALQPNNPIVNAPNMYVNGLNLSWPFAVPSSHLLNLSSGAARDSTNINDILLNDAVVLDASKVGVANGLDTGVFAQDIMYAVYVIGDSTGYQPSAGLISASFVQPHLPLGYDMFRRVGSALSYDNGGPTFADAYQVGNGAQKVVYYYSGPTLLLNGNATVWTLVALNQLVPPVVGGKAILGGNFLGANISDIAAIVPWRSDYASFVTFVNMSPFFAPVAAYHQVENFDMPYGMNGSVPTVVYNVTDAADSLSFSVVGYYDYL